MNAVKRGAEVLISVMLWAVILVAALFAFTTLATKDTNKVASLAGYTPLTVASDSMSPTFRAGDLIVIRKCDPGKLEEGDIITFHTIINNEYALNTHRIAEIQEEGGVRSYVTKGDNNAIADVHMIADGDIVGKFVTKLPGVGKVMSFLSSSIGFLVVIVLPLLVFFVYQVYHLITVSIELKKALAVESIQEGSSDALLQAKEEAEKAKAEAERKQKAIQKEPKRKNVALYNEKLEELCGEMTVTFLNAGFILEQDPSLYEKDGIHARKDFYYKWLTYMADMAGISE